MPSGPTLITIVQHAEKGRGQALLGLDGGVTVDGLRTVLDDVTLAEQFTQWRNGVSPGADDAGSYFRFGHCARYRRHVVPVELIQP